MLGVGNGAFTFEGGAMYYRTSLALAMNDASGTYRATNDMHFVGIPVGAKWNYFERPLATFYVKGGVMPSFLMSHSGGLEMAGPSGTLVYDPAKNDILGYGGIGGTAPLGDSLAFVLDLATYHGFQDLDDNGTKSGFFSVGLGVSYEL